LGHALRLHNFLCQFGTIWDSRAPSFRVPDDRQPVSSSQNTTRSEASRGQRACLAAVILSLLSPAANFVSSVTVVVCWTCRTGVLPNKNSKAGGLAAHLAATSDVVLPNVQDVQRRKHTHTLSGPVRQGGSQAPWLPSTGSCLAAHCNECTCWSYKSVGLPLLPLVTSSPMCCRNCNGSSKVTHPETDSGGGPGGPASLPAS
jgi:hypothetical protein